MAYTGQVTTATPVEALKGMLKDNPDYAQGWHDNIAMCCYDAMRSEYGEKLDHDAAHRLANDGAARFMNMCFDVDTLKERAEQAEVKKLHTTEQVIGVGGKIK